MLSHSSGFPNWRSKEGEKLESEHDPGSAFRYSGEIISICSANGVSAFAPRRLDRKEVTTASDYGKFVIAAMNQTEMHAAQVKLRPGLSWALGWGVEEIQAIGIYGTGAITTAGRILSSPNLPPIGRIVMTNGNLGMPVAQRVVDHATGHEHPAFLWI